MAAISSLTSPNLLHRPSNSTTISRSAARLVRVAASFRARVSCDSSVALFLTTPTRRSMGRVAVASQEATVSVQGGPSSEEATARRLYVGNIPRTLTNSELATIFGEHGSVEKAEVMYDKYSGRSRRFAFVTMNSVEDANKAIENLNDTEIGGRQIKVNVTERPLQTLDMSPLQADESKYVDSPYKVYVGNLAKTVTTEILTNFFSERGKVLSAKVSRVPGTSKTSGFGFVSFSSEEDVEAAITSANNAFLEGQRIRVNKA